MNRLSPLSGQGSIAPKSTAGHLAKSVATVSDAEFHHVIFSPLHYEKNYAYPLIIWLHGAGVDERQLLRIMPLVSMRNYVAIAPRAPWGDGTQDGFRWRTQQRDTSLAAQLALDCVDVAASRYHIDRQRVFLAGYQSGGEMALRIAMRHPHRVAGAISIGGAFPRDGSPLSSLAAIRKLPLLIAAGQDSEHYPVERLCQDLRLFHAASLWVTIRQYSCGDEIHQRMLSDMNVWIMEQVTGQRLSKAESYTPGSQQTN
jgi:phospholipase/carboxylesterase